MNANRLGQPVALNRSTATYNWLLRHTYFAVKAIGTPWMIAEWMWTLSSMRVGTASALPSHGRWKSGFLPIQKCSSVKIRCLKMAIWLDWRAGRRSQTRSPNRLLRGNPSLGVRLWLRSQQVKWGGGESDVSHHTSKSTFRGLKANLSGTGWPIRRSTLPALQYRESKYDPASPGKASILYH